MTILLQIPSVPNNRVFIYTYLIVLYTIQVIIMHAQDAALDAKSDTAPIQRIVGSSNLIYFLSNDQSKNKVEILATPNIESVVEVLGGYYDQKLKKDFPDPKNDHMELKGTLSILRCFKGQIAIDKKLSYIVPLPVHMSLLGTDLPQTSLIDGGTAFMVFDEVPSTTLESLPKNEFSVTKSFQEALSLWDGQSPFGNDSILSDFSLFSRNTNNVSLEKIASKYDLAPDLATLLVLALESRDAKVHSQAIDLILEMCKQTDISSDKMTALIYTDYIAVANNLISEDESQKIEQSLLLSFGQNKNPESRKIARDLGMSALF